MIEFAFNFSKGGFNLNVDNTIPDVGVTAIFGPSGCGKTTLLRAIAGLEQKEAGKVKINETVWQGDQFIPTHERAVGFVFQEASLFPHLNVSGNLNFALKRTPENRRSISFEEVVKWLKLEQHLSKKPSQLSGGERQRVAIARALLTSPALLMMDEPLTGLDVKSKNEILSCLETLARELEIPVLYVSHDTGEVARLASHMLLMDNGKIIAEGTVCELFSRTDLPLSQESDAESIILTEVESHDDQYYLTTLKFSGGFFRVSKIQQSVGSEVKLRILAKGVSLTLKEPELTSILNIFPVTVKEVKALDDSSLNVLLDSGGTAILSRITKKSGDTLGIKPEMELFAQVKSVELLV